MAEADEELEGMEEMPPEPVEEEATSGGEPDLGEGIEVASEGSAAGKMSAAELKEKTAAAWKIFWKTFGALFTKPNQVVSDFFAGSENYLNPYSYFAAVSIIFLGMTNLIPWESLSTVFFQNSHTQWLKVAKYWMELWEVPPVEIATLLAQRKAIFLAKWLPFFQRFTYHFFSWALWTFMGLAIPIIAFLANRANRQEEGLGFKKHLVSLMYFTSLKITLLIIYSPLLVVGFGFAFVSGFLLQLLFNVPMKLFFSDLPTAVSESYKQLMKWYQRILLLAIFIIGWLLKSSFFA